MINDMIDFIDAQLAEWPMARANYQALGKTERRSMKLGDLIVGIQHNPARIVSTAAKTDAETLAKRPCFLCEENRPPQQKGLPIAEGWELLLNPFPIFPTHYTIISTTHRPQEGLPLEMIEMAEKLPGHTIFFNGKKAGASCPDHMHAQAVMTHELPLMRLVEKKHVLPDNPQLNDRVATSSSLGLDVPFGFISIIVTPDDEGRKVLSVIGHIIGKDIIDEGKHNTFVWIDGAGLLRIVAVPRDAHRPSCYFAEDETHRMISPGCIDMTGVLIVPVKEDYEHLTEEEVRKIYQECGMKL